MQKQILHISHPRDHHWVGDGFLVSQYIPGYGKAMSSETSPFLMLDYNAPRILESRNDGHRSGVGYHPHRGFETVTIVYSGEVEHQDTAGNGGVIGPDEVQWMTAGSGLLHSEFFTREFSRSGGLTHFVQLWIDLPKEYKMTEPRYQALNRNNIPEVKFSGGKVRVIAGKYGATLGPAMTYSPVELYDIRFEKEGAISLTFPLGYTTMILVIDGGLHIHEKNIETGDMVTVSPSGSDISLVGSSISRLLVMAGEPLGQRVVNYGPFVMNSEEEIMEAFADLRSGKMGRVSEE